MVTPKTKASLGMTLIVLFLATLVTGIILHLKKHGIIIEPRPGIKVVHWICGFVMAALTIVHGLQFKKMLNALRAKYTWVWIDTWALILFIGLTFITGLVKLLSPIKIPHLGLWHFWFGILMTLTAVVHLIRGIPGWNRLRKIKK